MYVPRHLRYIYIYTLYTQKYWGVLKFEELVQVHISDVLVCFKLSSTPFLDLNIVSYCYNTIASQLCYSQDVMNGYAGF